jgi:hypothetical protein
LVRVSPNDFQFEYGVEGEACIGYSFKSFYECGVTATMGHNNNDFNLEHIKLFEDQRKGKDIKFE